MCLGISGYYYFGGFRYHHEKKNSPPDDFLFDLAKSDANMLNFVGLLFWITSQIAAIPIYGNIVSENLFEAGILSFKWSFFYGNIMPWIPVIFIYNADNYKNLIDWASLLFVAFTNYSIPLWLYLKSAMRNDNLSHIGQRRSRSFTHSISNFNNKNTITNNNVNTI